MKKLLQILLFATLFLAVSNACVAQYEAFFKQSQERFMGLINNANAVLDKERSGIYRILSIRDSMNTNGDLKEEQSDQYLKTINNLKQHNEEQYASVYKYSTKLKEYSSLKKNLISFVKEIPAITNPIIQSDIVKTNTIATVKNEILKASSAGEKKALVVILNNAAGKQTEEAAKVGDIGEAKALMASSGNIDEAASANIDSRLSRYQSKIDSTLKEIEKLKGRIANPADYSKNSTIIKARVTLIDSVVNKSAFSREYSYAMIEEGLKKNTKSLFSLAAFFGPGGYIIAENKYDFARKYFAPLIDSLVKFSNQFSKIQRLSTIVINGYADAQQIMPTSKLVPIIASYLNETVPSKVQLNAGLSALRAEELSKLISLFINERSAEFLTLPKITFENIEIGRGEELPDPTIKNYKANDERRRIVIIYWSVLPNE